MSQERRGEEWIATKQIVVQCPVCQEYYHLKELKNVDQARNRKLSGVCRWPVLTNVDHVPTDPVMSFESSELPALFHHSLSIGFLVLSQVRYSAQKIECVRQQGED